MATVGGKPSVSVRGAGAAVWYQDGAGDRFVVPAVAVPYVGKQLGASLFDVSALARDGITGGARVPVALRFAPGARVAAPPGVTLTWARGQVARGYVTAASGRRLAAALARQDGADTVGGHLAAAARLFGGLTAMTLAAPTAPAAASPGYPMRTLRLKVTDETGHPANNALVFLMNTDKISRETAQVPVNNGVARLSVPAGDYSLYGFFQDFPPKASAHFTLYRDGTKLVSTSKAAGAVVTGIPARPSTYRAVLDVSLAGVPGFSQSTHTDLTMRYVPGGGTVLPVGDKCAGQSAGSPCQVLPALTLGYQFATSDRRLPGSPREIPSVDQQFDDPDVGKGRAGCGTERSGVERPQHPGNGECLAKLPGGPLEYCQRVIAKVIGSTVRQRLTAHDGREQQVAGHKMVQHVADVQLGAWRGRRPLVVADAGHDRLGGSERDRGRRAHLLHSWHQHPAAR